ncbi:MAG: RNase H1/viroplasmin domain-containing protein [Planctomycetales bacterium]
MAKKRKWYVVWIGYVPGIYDTWEECEHQVRGYSGAKFRSYRHEKTAKQAFSRGLPDRMKKHSDAPIPNWLHQQDENENEIDSEFQKIMASS